MKRNNDETMGNRSRMVTACVIVIGNEVLSGRTRDANIQMMGETLAAQGIRLCEARVIPDDETMIVETVNGCRARYDYVFTTGGIGPTHDDITAASIAKAFGLTLERNPEAERLLLAHYGESDLNAARLRMADLPQGARLIDNPVSRAPGFQVGNVYVLAGVPRIAKAMMDGVRHGLVGGRPVVSRAVVGYLRESDLADPLGLIQADFPDVDLGSYPFVRNQRFGVTIVGRGLEAAEVEAALDRVRHAMRTLGVEPEASETPEGEKDL